MLGGTPPGGTLWLAPHATHAHPHPPLTSSLPANYEALKYSAQKFISYDPSLNVKRESKFGRVALVAPGHRLNPSWPALTDIHYIDSSSGSEDGGSECGRRRRGEGACEGGQEAGGEDVVLIHDEVCAAEKGSTSATVGGGEHAAASRRSCCHDGGRAAVVSAGGSGVCMMKHKGGPLVTAQDHGDHDKPHASMAASDTALQQQPSGSATTMVTSTGGGGGGAPLRSALKRAGQKSRGHRVCINEAKNECLEADYVIVVHEESEPQLVSIRAFDLSLAPAAPAAEQLTLSPPEGYKDCFSRAVHETIVDDSETDAGGDGGLVEADAPRPHLPDLVTHRSPPTKLTVENVRHHDQLMQGSEQDPADPKVAKTGILKGGKLWKNGDGRKTKVRVEEEAEEPRRSVRFSGRDEYSLLESLPLDKIPLDAANSAALARFMPKLRELGMLLGEPRHDWHLELSPIKPEAEGGAGAGDQEGTSEEKEKQLPPQMDDEQIKESMQRYDEMRRRIAAAEGRDNTSVCSDESKSSSDSQSSDSTMTETRIRRLENTDVAHVAGGVMRSNSEVRRAIERNALRRSLIRFSEARKRDTNKNDKNEDKGEPSLLEKLKWLTASEDVTNGNSEEKEEGMEEDDGSQDLSKSIDPKVQETIAQYRKLAEMFNKTTSLRATDILVPGDVREWKLKADLFPSQARAVLEVEEEEVPEPHSGATTPTVYQGIIPAVSLADLVTDEETDKLIYSGGVRYTREGILPLEAQGEGEEAEGEQQGPSPTSSTAEARKQFLSQMASQAGTPHVSANGVSTLPGDRSSHTSNSDSYTFDDIDEVLHDDRSSSVPSSSQSSPRLSSKSDVDGASTTESGYSSNETNGELQLPINGLQGLPIGGVDIDELAEFVRQDAGRMERLRRRYDAGELEDHGFSRRPSVRGIKPRFGSTTDLLKQMATQLAPPTMAQPGMAGSHMTWPYRDVGDEDTQPPQRRRASQNRAVLPALQEDILYTPTSDLSPQGVPPPPCSSAALPAMALTHTKAPRVVHVYASTGDLRAPPPPRLSGPRESPPPDLIRPGGAPMPMPMRALTHSLSQPLPDTSPHGLMMVPQMPTPMLIDPHYPSCRRPASVHGHLPPDSLVMRGVPPPPSARPHSTLSHYPNPRVPVHYHSYEDPPPTRTSYEASHPPLGQRGSYPGTIPAPLGVHYQPQLVPPDAIGFPQPPPYGSHHSHSLPRPPPVSPREAAPYTRTLHSQVHPGPQTSSMVAHPGQPHQCGPRQVRMVSGLPEQVCSPAWSHQQPHSHQNFAQPYPVSSHLSYTTPIVPESVMTSRPSGQPVGAPLGPPTRPIGPLIGPPMGPPIMNGGVGKLEGLRDERGVPEGASSSPRGPLEPQYPHHNSPTRDSGLLHRHPPPLNMT